MTHRTTRWPSLARALACSLSLAALGATQAAHATVVEFQTVLGNFQVNLFDETTPITVANFLDYVNNGAYTDSIIHRSVDGFVIQGGGFFFDGELPIETIIPNPAILNEPALSNVRGTIAMAKLAGNENSATSQWFFNLVDNSLSLDPQNGGFTVFGVVLGDGMDVVDAISDVPVFDIDGLTFTTIPLRDVTDPEADPDENNFVIVSSVVVTDTTVSTNLDLLPPENTLIIPTVLPPDFVIPTNNGGGGASGWLSILLLGALRFGRRTLTR